MTLFADLSAARQSAPVPRRDSRPEWGTSPAEPSTPPGRHEFGNPKFGAHLLGIGTALCDILDDGFQLKLDISHATHRVADRADVVGHGNCPRSVDGRATTCVFRGNRRIVRQAGGRCNPAAYQ